MFFCGLRDKKAVMKRQIMPYLQQWLHKPQRKPLIMRGARQVGKTWLVRHLAELEGKQLIELNIEREPRSKSFFNTNDPKLILQNIGHYCRIKIHPEKVILFLDEIQVAPELLAVLRWFSEEMPELPVIAAGSLLDFVLASHSFSMPVGRISYVHVEPLSFEEFLGAMQQEGLVDFLRQYSIGAKASAPTQVPTIIHDQLMRYVREYIFVGGLPSAVACWADTKLLVHVHETQHDLLSTYRDDFAKYRGRLTPERVEDIWHAVPKMLGKPWKYSHINPDVQSSSLKQALHLLTLAKICHPVYACAADGLPLAAGARERIFKVLFLDIGLVSTALGFSLPGQIEVNAFSLINEGGLAEQFVGQGLRTSFPFYVEPALYYWCREKSGSSAEVDYLLQHGTDIIPIEVKAGTTGQMRSLHLLMALRGWPRAVRFNADYPSMTTVTATTHDKNNHQYQLLSLPFYFIGQLSRLLDEQ